MIIIYYTYIYLSSIYHESVMLGIICRTKEPKEQAWLWNKIYITEEKENIIYSAGHNAKDNEIHESYAATYSNKMRYNYFDIWERK